MADAPRPLDPNLVAYLSERDEHCPSCSYNLRGLKVDRCPECNRELVVQIRLAEPRMAAWLTALIGSCTMLGFNGLLSFYFIVVVSRRGMGGPRDRTIATVLYTSTAIAGIALAFLLYKRRWVCNLHSPAREVIAVFAWLLTALSSIMFFSMAG